LTGGGFITLVDEIRSMALDVATPEPPDLTNRPVPSRFDAEEDIEDASDLRREELEQLLRDGAWNEAFREWTEYTDLTEAEFRTIRHFDLFEQIDVYWDPVETRLRFEVPTLPAELSEEDLAAYARTELTDLGQTLIELLADTYVDWDDSEPSLASWSEELFSEDTPPE
jgi:hypothetical protein